MQDTQAAQNPEGGQGQNKGIESVELNIYDVRDLTQTIKDFPGPAMQMSSNAQEGHGGGNPFVTAPADNQPAAPTLEMLRERVATEPSRDNAAQANEFSGLVGQRAADAESIAKKDSPAWTKLAGRTPTEDEFTALRAKVDAQPKDRGPRNAYAFALAQAGNWDTLQAQCFDWLPFDPENAQVFEYLGKSAAGLKDEKTALRALSSIAEIAPNDAALLGRAGWVLLSVKQQVMAEALFREALKQRQDDANLYRGLALSLWQAGKHEDAAKVYEDALKVDFDDRYGDVKRVLTEEFAYLLRAWREALGKKQDGVQPEMQKRIEALGDQMRRTDALRVTLCWETDANDVDLYVTDPIGEECFYSHKQNASGLELYSDQTQGLGPEVIRCEKAQKGAYHIGVDYFSAGPMGVSRGVVVVFQPKDGIVTQPTILPFSLVPDAAGKEGMWHLAVITFHE